MPQARQRFEIASIPVHVAADKKNAEQNERTITLHAEIDEDNADHVAWAKDIDPAFGDIFNSRLVTEGSRAVHLHPQFKLPAMTMIIRHEGMEKNAKGVDEKAMVKSFHFVAAEANRPIVKIPSHAAQKAGEEGSRAVVVFQVSSGFTDAEMLTLRRIGASRGVLEMFPTTADLEDAADA